MLRCTRAARRDERGAAHRSLVLSREVLLVNGTMKIVVAQPDPSILACKTEMPPKNNDTLGWRYRNHTWRQPAWFDKSGCGLAFYERARFQPCLFDVQADPRETVDLSAAQPALREGLGLDEESRVAVIVCEGATG